MVDISRQRILDLIHQDARLENVWDLVNNQSYDDPSHDIGHLLRVARWTNNIVAIEMDHVINEGLIESTAAALLHDFVNVPKNHPDRSAASALSADKARSILGQVGFDDVQSSEIAAAIRTHSFSRGEAPVSLLGKALQDADRLDALGAIGICRCIAISTQMGAKFVHSEDPWASHRSLDDGAFSVDHFFTKLFLLPEKMNTETGRLEANKRVDFMKMFLSELGTEIDFATE